jgi:hypothetical protein
MMFDVKSMTISLTRSLTRVSPVAGLADALAEENPAGARALVRSLVDSVTLHPEGKGDRVEVRGERAAILGLGCHFKPSGRIPSMFSPTKSGCLRDKKPPRVD